MITGVNESKILTNHILCKCKCKFIVRKCHLNQNGITINVGVIIKIQKCIDFLFKKDYIWNSATFSFKTVNI